MAFPFFFLFSFSFCSSRIRIRHWISPSLFTAFQAKRKQKPLRKKGIYWKRCVVFPLRARATGCGLHIGIWEKTSCWEIYNRNTSTRWRGSSPTVHPHQIVMEIQTPSAFSPLSLFHSSSSSSSSIKLSSPPYSRAYSFPEFSRFFFELFLSRLFKNLKVCVRTSPWVHPGDRQLYICVYKYNRPGLHSHTHKHLEDESLFFSLLLLSSPVYRQNAGSARQKFGVPSFLTDGL